MSDWYPTPELRHIKRVLATSGELVAILQQLWICNSHHQEKEWRDIPLVEERDE